MSNLHVIAEIIAKPGSEDTIRSALSALAKVSKTDEGCNSYELFESAASAGTFFTVEDWRSQEDLDAHMQTEHVAAAFAAAGEHVASAPAIHPLSRVAD